MAPRLGSECPLITSGLQSRLWFHGNSADWSNFGHRLVVRESQKSSMESPPRRHATGTGASPSGNREKEGAIDRKSSTFPQGRLRQRVTHWEPRWEGPSSEHLSCSSLSVSHFGMLLVPPEMMRPQRATRCPRAKPYGALAV